MTTSIYKNQADEIRDLFESAGSTRKVLCVAIDYAKTKHVALICDGNGDVMKQPFPVVNSREGAEFLHEQISASARKRKIPLKHIFIGGEDLPSYVENFTDWLRQRGYLVIRVNALEAKKQRENEIASTDNLDVLAIAKTMIARRARVVGGEAEESDPVYRSIRDLSRIRSKQVRDTTAISNQIHTYVDRLFPGFLDSSKSGITPFSQASLALMKDEFSSTKIARKKQSSFSKTLRRLLVRQPEETAGKLISLAKHALPPNSLYMSSQQQSLAACVELYECADRISDDLKREAAVYLASTPYAFLTTIPGISFVIGAGTAGELGSPLQLGSPDNLCGYAGIAPGLDQTGGPDAPPVMKRTKPRCNRRLKHWVSQAAERMEQWGDADWKARSQRWDNNGQHALFAGARRYVRVTRCLVINQIAYQSAQARGSTATKEVRAWDAEETWQRLIRKWKVIPNYQEIAFAEDKPLGFWRRTMMELYKAQMPMPKK